jgi:hypothetical protein
MNGKNGKALERTRDPEKMLFQRLKILFKHGM